MANGAFACSSKRIKNLDSISRAKQKMNGPSIMVSGEGSSDIRECVHVCMCGNKVAQVKQHDNHH